MNDIEINEYFTTKEDDALLNEIKVDGYSIKQIYDELEKSLINHLERDMTDGTFLYLGIRIKQMLKTIIFLYKQLNGEVHTT